MRHAIGRGTAVLAAVLLTAYGQASDASPSPNTAAPPSPSGPVQAPAEPVLRLDFDEGRLPAGRELKSFHSSGTASVRADAVTAGGGAVIRQPGQPSGWAVGLPAYSASDPGYAVVRVTNDGPRDPFSPGTRPFSFGADFAVDATSAGTPADNGDNLVQRGLYDDPGQYKIQLDGRRASCRVKGSSGAVSVRATAAVAAGRWHRVWCTRRIDTVTLQLGAIRADGSVQFTKFSRRGSIGSVRMPTPTPLSVGGKLKSDGTLVRSATDQFNGRVDQVFYRLLG